MRGNEGYTPTTARLIVMDKSGKILHDYSFDYDATGESNFGIVKDDDGKTKLDEKGNPHFYVKYPVPASDLTKEDTIVQLSITMRNAENDEKIAESSEFEYGIYAYLARQLWQHTQPDDQGEIKSFEHGGKDKTNEYVNMLVSLIKLGEAVNRIEAMKPSQQQ